MCGDGSICKVNKVGLETYVEVSPVVKRSYAKYVFVYVYIDTIRLTFKDKAPFPSKEWKYDIGSFANSHYAKARWREV